MEIIDRRYQVICELGNDKFTAVYHARDLEKQRDVALKILRVKYFDTTDILKLFVREANTLLHLKHKAISPFYDFGHYLGLPYFVMKYLCGASLETRLRITGPMSPCEGVSLIIQLAEALNYIHEQGFVYRYLKSGNVLFDSLNQPYLVNFFITYHESYKEIFSEFGHIGPAYAMAPEQWHLETPTHRVDIFQLGVLAFEILSGKRPIQAYTASNYDRKYFSRPVAPITFYKPNLPSTCNEVFQKALAKDPADRYVTAVDFANALSQVIKQ